MCARSFEEVDSMWPFRKETPAAEIRSEEPAAVDILPMILGQRLNENDVLSIPALVAPHAGA